MTTAAASCATDAALAHWLRLLWDQAPALHLGSEAPFIAGGGIHLPAQAHWRQHCAAAAHAAAHLVYSPSHFDAAGLVPLARTVLALLEDARVEALAARELPGLARLWRPLHTASAADPPGCEALLHRLARALVDPTYVDSEPWVAKGRRLFYLDETLALPALRTPQELREAALRLSHDLGQMRLQFNAKGYRPLPAYRDDHRWMWAADQLAAQQPPPPSRALAGDAALTPRQSPEPPPTYALDGVTWHPEWDRLIQRLRPHWARVIEHAAPALPATPAPAPAPVASSPLQQALRALTRPTSARGRSAEGEQFDPDALLDWRLARTLRQPPDARVYRAPRRSVARAAVCLLVDQSASTADPLGASGASVLQAAAHVATDAALALQALGVGCMVAAFSSNGRQAVHWRVLKTWSHRADGALAARLRRLPSSGSTRLGAALRHGALHLTKVPARVRWILVVSDGQTHDIDIHDPNYLVEDARHAVRRARHQGVRIACIHLADRGPAARSAAERIFGRQGVQSLQRVDSLPKAARRLLA